MYCTSGMLLECECTVCICPCGFAECTIYHYVSGGKRSYIITEQVKAIHDNLKLFDKGSYVYRDMYNINPVYTYS